MGSNARRGRNSMVGIDHVGVVTRCFYGSRTLPPGEVLLDLAQPQEGCCFNNKRHPSPFDGHTLCWRMGDELDRTRSQVHRLRNASYSGSLAIFRLPAQGHSLVSCVGVIKQVKPP